MSPLPQRPTFNSGDNNQPVKQNQNVFEEETTEHASTGLTIAPKVAKTEPVDTKDTLESSSKTIIETVTENNEPAIADEEENTVIRPNKDFLPTEKANDASVEDLYGSGTIPTPPKTQNISTVNEQPISLMDEEPISVEDAIPVDNNNLDNDISPEIDYELEKEEAEEEERKRQIDSLSLSAKTAAQKLLALISDDTSSEVVLNGPHEVMYKVNGQRFFAREIDFDSIEEYHMVINTLILYDTDTQARIGTDAYLIEGQLELPDYENENAPSLHARVHIIAPPVVKAAKVTIAKKAKKQFQLEDLAAKGAMNQPMLSFLKALSRGRATIVFSGLSGSGKTTLLEAMSYNFDENDRAIVVEDTAELSFPLSDVVYLLSTSKKPGQDPSTIITLEWLVSQANRMRPERIIVGEIRGGEIAEFLSAANSGADGSMTTVHASSPRQTIDKMLSLAMKSTTAKNEASVLRDIASTVQIIVQTALVDGKHVISQIEEVSDTVLKNGTGISMQPIFQYDRNTGKYFAVGRPSDQLLAFLGQRGVAVESSWFART